jgi:hypothetical protein
VLEFALPPSPLLAKNSKIYANPLPATRREERLRELEKR